MQGRLAPLGIPVGGGEKALNKFTPLLLLQVHRCPREFVHQFRRHGRTVIHRQYQTLAVGGYRGAIALRCDPLQSAGAQVGDDGSRADAVDDCAKSV